MKVNEDVESLFLKRTEKSDESKNPPMGSLFFERYDPGKEGVSLEKREIGGEGHKSDFGLRVSFPKGFQEGSGKDNIPEGTETDQQDLHSSSPRSSALIHRPCCILFSIFSKMGLHLFRRDTSL